MYGQGTAEARFLQLHFVESEAKRVAWERWQGARMLDLFAAAAAGKSNDSSRQTFLRKTMQQLDDILSMASPFAKDAMSHAQKTMSDEKKAALLSQLNALQDKSDEAIIGTMLAMTANVKDKAS